jgi:hypothetical protein
MNLIKYSDSREQEARRILEELSIEKEIGKLGKLTIVGSINHHTMIKPDIDLVIYVKDKKSIDKIIQNLKDIFKKNSRFYGEWTEDRRSLFGKSIHVFYKTKIIWKFDILVTTNKLFKDKQFNEILKRIVKTEKRKNILKLKYYFYKKKLSTSSLSMHIYNAVINQDTRNVKEFFNCLAEKGINRKDFKHKEWYKN